MASSHRLREFIDVVRRYTDAHKGISPVATLIPGLQLLRSDHEKRPNYILFKPALCVVVQGAKWAIFGGQRMDYRAGQALVISLEMPALGTVAEASPEEPYLGFILEFDLGVMREVMESLQAPPTVGREVRQGVFVTDFDGPLADSTLRLVKLLETPEAIPALYPAVMREVCYWLLTGAHGGEVMRMTLGKSHTERVLRAIHSLRDRFSEPVRMRDLAKLAQMSASAFHRQFKAITSMTPLQYQKQLRLLEARRLMLADEVTVETAAFRVGYESASQFSREYSRLFGVPPRRDVASMREALA